MNHPSRGGLSQDLRSPQARHRPSAHIPCMRILLVDLMSGPGPAGEAPGWADGTDSVLRVTRPSELSWTCVDVQPDAVVIHVDTAGTYDTLVVRSLRGEHIHTPVSVLAEAADGESVARALDSGADDVVPAPVSVVEMRARLRALIRRPAAWEPDELASGPLAVDLLEHRAQAHGREIGLTPVQFRLLVALMRNAGRTLTRDQLRDSVWDPAARLGSNVVDQAVSGLRTRLDEHGVRHHLRTIRGVGYRLEEPRPGSRRENRAA